MKTIKALALSSIFLGLFATACIKSAIPIPPPPPSGPLGSVSITGISPVSGTAGISDTLTGKGFSSAVALDSVYFNGISARILSASTTQLIVVVPSGVTTGDVTVNVSGQAATGPLFTVGTDTTTYLNDTVYTVSTLVNGLDVPVAVVLDASGNLFVIDDGFTSLIKKITPSGVVSVFAGSGTSDINGLGTSASFNSLQSIAVDPGGNLYVTEPETNMIRKITAGGLVSTFAGTADTGYVDAIGTAARFWYPFGITSNSQGNLYVFDGGNFRMRMLTSGAAVTTIAGSGAQGSADGVGSAASLGRSDGMCVDAGGNIYMADMMYNTIRKVTPAGDVTTIAGVPNTDYFYEADGVGTLARFAGPDDIAADKYGNFYIADNSTGGTVVRKMTPSGVVTTIAGIDGVQGSADGPGHQATFMNPWGLAVAPSGVIYVCDAGSHSIRVLTPLR
jgi:sugar lactone lactonase YvrE